MTSTGTGVSTAVRDVPTTTTLAPASGAPDSVATTVPDTVPVCCATKGITGTTRRDATRSGSMGVDLTGHLLEDDGLLIQVCPSNTAPPASALSGASTRRMADRPHPGFEREPLELLDRLRQQQIDPAAQRQ